MGHSDAILCRLLWDFGTLEGPKTHVNGGFHPRLPHPASSPEKNFGNSFKIIGKKKEPKPKMFGTGVGLPGEGVRPKSSVCASQPKETKVFGRINPGFFAGISWRCPEKFEINMFVFIFFRSFDKGVGGHRGLAQGNPSLTMKLRPFFCPFFLCPFMSRKTQFCLIFFAVFWALFRSLKNYQYQYWRAEITRKS